MLNNESFFNSEEEKLLALIKTLKEDEEFNVQSTMWMKYARDFKNQELINEEVNQNKQYNYKFTQFTF